MPKVGSPLPGAAAEECGQPGRGWGCRGGALVDEPCTPFFLCHTPLPSRAIFLSLTQWPLGQDESEQGAADKQGPIKHGSGGDLETQPQLLTMPVNSSVLTDLNLLGATPNSPSWSQGS